MNLIDFLESVSVPGAFFYWDVSECIMPTSNLRFCQCWKQEVRWRPGATTDLLSDEGKGFTVAEAVLFCSAVYHNYAQSTQKSISSSRTRNCTFGSGLCGRLVFLFCFHYSRLRRGNVFGPVCLCVCLYYSSFWTLWRRQFIFVCSIYLQNIWVKFVYKKACLRRMYPVRGFVCLRLTGNLLWVWLSVIDAIDCVKLLVSKMWRVGH